MSRAPQSGVIKGNQLYCAKFEQMDSGQQRKVKGKRCSCPVQYLCVASKSWKLCQISSYLTNLLILKIRNSVVVGSISSKIFIMLF